MMGEVARKRGSGDVRFLLDDDGIHVDSFLEAAAAAVRAGAPLCIAGTAFAFVALVDALEARGVKVACPTGSRIMETGGFKGRSRSVERGGLYDALSALLEIPRKCIVAEYGMTELTSQFYDSIESRTSEPRVKAGPPWLRTLVVDADGHEVTAGDTGYLHHVDLANRSSALAVATEDRGYTCPGGFVLLGRDLDAPLRGCSLRAEELLARGA
jgi:hypothetical protein